MLPVPLLFSALPLMKAKAAQYERKPNSSSSSSYYLIKKQDCCSIEKVSERATISIAVSSAVIFCVSFQ
jgi:hypothetical protein